MPAAPWPLDVRLEFRAATFGHDIGARGLRAADLDGDGESEIVATAIASSPGPYTHFWYAVSRRGTRYVQTWVGEDLFDQILSLTVANVDDDAALEVLVGAGNQVRVYDGVSRARQGVFVTGSDEVRSLQVADLDSDGAPEMVFCGEHGLYVHDARTGVPELQALPQGCHSVAVGNVDGDPALEIVTGNGEETGYVVDGVSRAVQWAYPLGFGTMVHLGDLDGNGIAEIVAADQFTQISILDAVARVEVDAIYPPYNVTGLGVADVEGDGPLEILWGETYGDIHVVDGATRVEKWALDNPGSNASRIVVADTDGDTARELWWGMASGANDRLVVADTATRQVEWESLDFRGPFYGLAHGDVEGNGKPDFLYTSFESRGQFPDGRYFVHGAIGKRLRYVSPPPTTTNFTGLARVHVANLDGDPQLEVLVGSGEIFQGTLICYDGLTHAEQWRAPVEYGLTIWSLQVADVDADGQLEVVVGTASYFLDGPMFVYVFNAATGLREWRSPNMGDGGAGLSLLRIAQVDNDPAPEILVAEYRGRLFAFDGVTHVLSLLLDDQVTAFEIKDRDAGRHEVVVGTEDGTLRVLKSSRRGRDRPIGRFGGRIDGLAVADLNADGHPDYAFAVDSVVSIVDGATRAVVWRSERLGWEAGAKDSLLLADLDEDGSLELMVNTGNVGVDIYEVPAP